MISAERNTKVRDKVTTAMVVLALELDSLGYDIDIVQCAKDAQYIMSMNSQIRVEDKVNVDDHQ